jgi:hypothetical protein
MNIGKEHESIAQCRLCEVAIKDFEELETHLATCDIYKCENCDDVFTNLKDLKMHFLNDHEKENARSVEINIKQNRNNSGIYDIRSYKFEDLFQQD